MAFYDFSGVQYHSFIRSRHVNVQGQNGEWNDTFLRYVNEQHLPETERIAGWLDPAYECLVTQPLLECCQWKHAVEMEHAQDEYAIATMMYDMRAYLESGREVYPMAEALEDAYQFLLIQEAVKEPGQRIVPEPMPWR